MTFEIKWTGKTYTDDIDNLDAAYAAAQAEIDKYGFDAETVYHLTLGDAEQGVSGGATVLWLDVETRFGEIAFMGWSNIPDGWSLITT